MRHEGMPSEFLLPNRCRAEGFLNLLRGAASGATRTDERSRGKARPWRRGSFRLQSPCLNQQLLAGGFVVLSGLLFRNASYDYAAPTKTLGLVAIGVARRKRTARDHVAPGSVVVTPTPDEDGRLTTELTGAGPTQKLVSGRATEPDQNPRENMHSPASAFSAWLGRVRRTDLSSARKHTSQSGAIRRLDSPRDGVCDLRCPCRRRFDLQNEVFGFSAYAPQIEDI